MENASLSKGRKRPYHSRVRQRQAEETHQRILAAARGILAELVNPDAFDPHIQQLLDQLRTSREPVQRVELVVLITRQVYESLASEFELLRTAGVVDLELADLARQIEGRRRQNQSYLIADLHEQGLLRHGLPPEEAIDILWSLTSYDLYRMLVLERRWLPEGYETWLAHLLIQHLLQSVDE